MRLFLMKETTSSKISKINKFFSPTSFEKGFLYHYIKKILKKKLVIFIKRKKERKRERAEMRNYLLHPKILNEKGCLFESR